MCKVPTKCSYQNLRRQVEHPTCDVKLLFLQRKWAYVQAYSSIFDIDLTSDAICQTLAVLKSASVASHEELLLLLFSKALLTESKSLPRNVEMHSTPQLSWRRLSFQLGFSHFLVQTCAKYSKTGGTSNI